MRHELTPVLYPYIPLEEGTMTSIRIEVDQMALKTSLREKISRSFHKMLYVS